MGLDDDWTTGTALTKNDDGSYSYTFTYDTETTITFQLKYGSGWGAYEGKYTEGTVYTLSTSTTGQLTTSSTFTATAGTEYTLKLVLNGTSWNSAIYTDDDETTVEQSLYPSYYVPGSWNKWETSNTSSKMTRQDDGSYTFTYDFTSGSEDYTFKFYCNGTWYSGLTTDGNSTAVTNITTSTLYQTTKGNDLVLTPTTTGTYTFRFIPGSDANYFYVLAPGETDTVTVPTTTTTTYQIKGSWDSWATDNEMIATADSTYSYTVTLTSGTEYDFLVHTGETYYKSAAVSAADTKTAMTEEVISSAGSNCSFTPETTGEYKFVFTIEDDGYYITVYDYTSVKFYLLVPEENLGNFSYAQTSVGGSAVPEGYKAIYMQANHERNQTTLNNDLVSVGLKIDGDNGRELRYDASGDIKFVVMDNQGNYYQPKDGQSALHYTTDGNDDNYERVAANGEDSYNMRGYVISTTLNEDNFFTLNKENAGSNTMSLTFLFSSSNSAHTYVPDGGGSATLSNGNSPNGYYGDNVVNSGNVVVCFLQSRAYVGGEATTYYTNNLSDKYLYLIGQTNGTSYVSDTSFPMTKVAYFSDGSIKTSTDGTNITNEASADSIVYVYTVKNDEQSWDAFYLAFNPASNIGSNNTPSNWNFVFRPMVQDQMDAQAKFGGVMYFSSTAEDALFYSGVKWWNGAQCLNPKLTDDEKERYGSYQVRFNATYSTYNIQFFDKFSIAGSAVHGTTGQTSDYYASSYRRGMSRFTSKDTNVKTETINDNEYQVCYSYTGTFTRGGYFAFFPTNDDTYTAYYAEDDNALTDPGSDYTSIWQYDAPTDGGDYAYHNELSYTSSDGTLDDVNTNAILWTLPTGTYTVRFYILSDDTYVYTVDKSVKSHNAQYTNSAGTVTNYYGWTSFSDDCVLEIPSGITAYYVSNVSDGVVQLSKISGSYIPAHFPVLLYNESLEGEGGVEKLSLPVRPSSYTDKQSAFEELADATNTYMVDCSTSDPTTIYAEDNGYYNYLFTYTYHFTDGSEGNVPLGFYYVYQGQTVGRNSSYLHVSKYIEPQYYDNSTESFSTTNPNTTSSAKCFTFEFVNDNTATGINNIEDTNSLDEVQGWYNLQGMKISKPTKAGLYIHNGEKILIK